MSEGGQGHGTQGERFQKVSAIHDGSLDPTVVTTVAVEMKIAHFRQRFEGDDVREKVSVPEGVSTE